MIKERNEENGMYKIKELVKLGSMNSRGKCPFSLVTRYQIKVFKSKKDLDNLMHQSLAGAQRI